MDLHYAAKNRYFLVCELIMENVEDKNPQIGSGQTLLHLAAMEGHFEICQLLLKNTIDRNPKNFDDKTPLDLAMENNHQKICDLMLFTVSCKSCNAKCKDIRKHLTKTRTSIKCEKVYSSEELSALFNGPTKPIVG